MMRIGKEKVEPVSFNKLTILDYTSGLDTSSSFAIILELSLRFNITNNRFDPKMDNLQKGREKDIRIFTLAS